MKHVEINKFSSVELSSSSQSAYEVTVDGDYIGEFEPSGDGAEVIKVTTDTGHLAEEIDLAGEASNMILRLWRMLPEREVSSLLGALEAENLNTVVTGDPVPSEVVAWLDRFAAVGGQSDSTGSRLMRAKLYSDRLEELEGLVLSVYDWINGGKE